MDQCFKDLSKVKIKGTNLQLVDMGSWCSLTAPITLGIGLKIYHMGKEGINSLMAAHTKVSLLKVENRVKESL